MRDKVGVDITIRISSLVSIKIWKVQRAWFDDDEKMSSLCRHGWKEAGKRLIAVLAVSSPGNDKQFGETPLSQIESLQTNCNCQIAQFRTIRLFYPGAKSWRKTISTDRKNWEEEFWTLKLPRWPLFFDTLQKIDIVQWCWLLRVTWNVYSMLSDHPAL